MKRNLLLLAVMVVAALFFATNSWGQTNDLGAPDSVMYKTLSCDHTYEQNGEGYDVVRVIIYVTHDSNTFWWAEHDPPAFYQDSIQAMQIPLKFWHQPAACADSVVLPGWLVPGGPDPPGDVTYNNTEIQTDYLPYSIFRNITCPGESDIIPRMRSLNWATRILDIADSHSCDGDSGTAWLSLIAGTKRKWYQGSDVPLCQLTFWVYMNCETCDTTEIAIDSASKLETPPLLPLFVRMDAKPYVPWFPPFPVKDTIYCVPCLPPGIVCPTAENQDCSGTYTSLTAFTATDPNDPTVNITSVVATAPAPATGITAASVVYLTGDVQPPAAVVTGHVQYTIDHCAGAGGAITLTATNGCEPPLSNQCSFNVTISANVKPTVHCPSNVSGPYNVTLVSGDYTAGDECLPPTVSYNVVGARTHEPQPVGQHFEWDAFCTESITIWVIVTDDCGAKDSCSFTMTGTNAAPEVTAFDLPATLGSGNSVTDDFDYTDANGGVVAAGGYANTDCGTISVNLGAKKFTYDAPDVTAPTTCNVCIWVEDECGLRDTLCKSVDISVKPVGCNITVEIPNKVYERFNFGHWDYIPEQEPELAGDNCIVFDEACPGWWGINPGDFFEIPIILSMDQTYPIAGFELEVEFDYIDLTFYGADRGGLLQGRYHAGQPDVFYSWEYFSYRVLPCPTCACCKYKILLYGQAEMPDGDLRLGYTLDPTYLTSHEVGKFWYNDVIKDACPDGEVIDGFATLAWLKFQVANNELLRDLKLPIVFEFEQKLDADEMVVVQDWDCAENTMTNASGGVMYVSCDPMQYSDKCPDGDSIFHIVYYKNGGVHICSPCTAFTCVRGDINMDKVPYSTADAVLFANYFVHGLGVFTMDRDAQVCATDINADGRTLMLADLIYLIRVIQQDAIPFPKLGPSSDVANVIVSDGRITVECASAIGGILFKFDGAVTPTLLNTNMELLSNEGNVLVWSSAGHSINAGASQLLTASGELVSVIAVDREGRDLATTITTKLAPSTFTLHPAYPNPFNPNTTLSFSLPTAVSYSMNIYNVAGQLVRSYQGAGNVGLNVITWNGKDNAGNDVSSGVYFYKLIAGSFTATNKMVMMK